MTQPPPPLLRPATAADTAAIVSINAAVQELTAPMDANKYTRLQNECDHVLAAENPDGGVVAFLMAMGDAANYESVNYRWFAARIKNFCYIDRVAVAAQARGGGCGRALYGKIRQLATAQKRLWLAADITAQPPNAQSLRFHAKQGFVEAGRQTLADGRVVSMQLCPLTP